MGLCTVVDSLATLFGRRIPSISIGDLSKALSPSFTMLIRGSFCLLYLTFCAANFTFRARSVLAMLVDDVRGGELSLGPLIALTLVRLVDMSGLQNIAALGFMLWWGYYSWEPGLPLGKKPLPQCWGSRFLSGCWSSNIRRESRILSSSMSDGCS